MRHFRWSLLLVGVGLAAGVAASACTAANDPPGTNEQAVTELDDVEWLDKAARVLRDGEGLGPHDDVAALTAMSRSDVIDLWMKDPRFGDSVLAFNLYYLGRGVDQVKTPKLGGGGFVYHPLAFEFPQTIVAARAALEGGDYFALYDGAPDYVTVADPVLYAGIVEGERERVGAEMIRAIERTPIDRVAGCERYLQAGLNATNRLRLLGFAPAIAIRQRWLAPYPGYPLTVDCSPTSTTSIDQLVASMRAVQAAIDEIWKSVEAQAVRTSVGSLSELSYVPVAASGLPPVSAALGSTFFASLPVSSTNFQRKRAAFLLKTYFCDDLTPLDIPSTETGSGDGGAVDVHAANPNCQACHHRLDPMGALLRDIGAGGQDFSGQQLIAFDDGTVFKGEAYARYLSQWQNPDGSFRAGYWIIGASGRPQRDPGWTDADGSRLPGLWSYMRRSPIVKSCLVRKLAEYVLGPKQVYDREWLAGLSAGLKAGPQSGAAFRATLKALLLSKTFRIHDPTKGVCYDLPPSAPPNRSPCAIAHIVNAHCVGCHGSAGGPGGLDLSSWTDVGGGTFSWSHVDENGQQLPRAESLRRILDRITTPDRNRRMPLLRAMPVEDFATFREWLTTNLEAPAP
jgi:hypothetical protein